MRTIFVLLLGFVAFQPAPAGIRLIVKGDDMGAGHGINVATIDAYKRGVLTTTPKVREVITRRGIKLTSYRDLAKP